MAARKMIGKTPKNIHLFFSEKTRKFYKDKRSLKIAESSFGKKKSPQHAQNIGNGHRGKQLPDHVKELKRKQSYNLFKSNPNWGFKKGHRRFTSEEHYKRMSRDFSGQNSWHWKGGASTESRRIRQSPEYRLWRKTVFLRDDFTCQFPSCLLRGVRLEANHILPFAQFPEQRLDEKNGITLCRNCHIKVTHHEFDFVSLFNEIVSQKYI